MCKHMVDGNEQKGHGKTTAVSEDAEAEIFTTFQWNYYIPHKKRKTSRLSLRLNAGQVVPTHLYLHFKKSCLFLHAFYVVHTFFAYVVALHALSSSWHLAAQLSPIYPI